MLEVTPGDFPGKLWVGEAGCWVSSLALGKASVNGKSYQYLASPAVALA